MSYQLESYSDRSIVLRSTPPDFFKPYSDTLKAYGKYNPHLTGGAGWIFPLKKKEEVETVLQTILQGNGTKNVRDPRYQMVLCPVVKPKVGDTLFLYLRENKVPLKVVDLIWDPKGTSSATVESSTEGNVHTMVLKFGQWQIPDIAEVHRIDW